LALDIRGPTSILPTFLVTDILYGKFVIPLIYLISFSSSSIMPRMLGLTSSPSSPPLSTSPPVFA
jgi:hypothetical protein